MRKIITVLAAAAITSGFGFTALASAASASTGPKAFTPDSAGYSVTQSRFRYVQDTVYLRPPSKFAAIDDGVSWETHLLGSDANGGQKVSVDINIGGDPQTDSSYHAWADVNGSAITLQGDIEFSPGQAVTESISYSRASGVVSVSAFDANGDSAFGQAFVGTTVNFRNPRIFGGFDPGSSFVAPSAPVTLAHFTNVKLTTYKGRHGTIAGPYAASMVLATSDGTSTGTVRAAPSGLGIGGSAFNVFFEPGT
jgi:hypothetical protein